jgi:hypothetical protein
MSICAADVRPSIGALCSAFGALTLIAGALAFAGAPKGDSKRVPAGTWGATGINMDVTDAGATLDYDCAHGTVDEPLTLDAEGRFDARGSHYREHGGPIREGAEDKGQPVHYLGQITEDTMTLTIKLLDGDTTVGSFTLARGKSGRIRKCM